MNIINQTSKRAVEDLIAGEAVAISRVPRLD